MDKEMTRHYEPGTPIKHRSLSKDTYLTKERFDQHGIHPLCLRCVTECDHPQYDAPGLKHFQCADYSDKED